MTAQGRMAAVVMAQEEMAQPEVALGPECDTLARAVEGDSEAFAALVRRHQRMVFSVAYHFFADPALAEDLAQDVFVQLYQSMGSIKSEAHLGFWLRQVTLRKCIDQARSRGKRRPVSLEDIAEYGSPAKEPDTLEVEWIRRLVAALPEKFRAVVVLRYQEDMGPNEIAAVLGWPLNTVKSRLHRALRMLQERLEKSGIRSG